MPGALGLEMQANTWTIDHDHFEGYGLGQLAISWFSLNFALDNEDLVIPSLV